MIDPVTLSALFTVGGKVIDRLFPDPTEAAAKKLELYAMEQAGDLKELEVSMSAIVMEAKSSDPWTSRARPSFLYVMYTMILFSIPMGFLFAWKPEVAQAVILGVQGWLAAIPSEMWGLFGVGYLGYVNKRSDEKARVLGQPVVAGLMSKILD